MRWGVGGSARGAPHMVAAATMQHRSGAVASRRGLTTRGRRWAPTSKQRALGARVSLEQGAAAPRARTQRAQATSA